MNWDNIRVLIQVNRLGSVQQAAQALCVNHSTVLRRLDQLEQELGVKLFQRSTRGYEITPVGESLLDEALAMEQHCQSLQRLAASKDTLNQGNLVFSCPPMGAFDLMPILAQFRQQNPDITLVVKAGHERSDLNKLEADVALRITNEPPEDYVGFKVLRLEYHLYAASDYLERSASLESLQDIEDWIATEMPGQAGGFVPWIKSINPHAKVSFIANSVELAAEAAAHGLGVTYLSSQSARFYPNLIKLPLTPFNAGLDVWLLTHRDLRFQPRIKRFIQFMKEQLSESCLS